MADNLVWTFFYGSNMDPEVLKSVDYLPREIFTAKLSGYDIEINPLANLIRSDAHCVYGIIASSTHAELNRLYGEYVQAKLGATYLAHPVLCEKPDGSLVPALCYLCPAMEAAPASDAYLEKIIGPARQFGFPDWYIARLEEFRCA